MSSNISATEISRYEKLFNQLQTVNGRLSGEHARQVFLRSKLPVETLGKIWDISDIDGDGSLDKSEFILAMHFVHRCLEGDNLPVTLPSDLIPLDKQVYFPISCTSCAFPQSISSGQNFNLALVPVQCTAPSESEFNRNSSLILALPLGETFTTQSTHTIPSVWPTVNNLQTYTFPDWVISAEELAKALKVFATIDLDADGLVTGPEVRDILMKSGLQQHILAQIWDLVDIQNTGLLNSEQFAVAMHLATEQLASGSAGHRLPSVLPPALIPPSLRPIPPDPSIFEESNKLLSEIEAINRERSSVQSAYVNLAVDSQRRATEANNKQRAIDTLTHTSRSLLNQRMEAERRLTDYAREQNTLESVLADLKNHVTNERQKVDEIRVQMSSQQVSAKSQEEELNRLRADLSELIREEALLQDKIIENRRHLEQVENENRLAQSRVDKASSRLNILESTKGQLLDVLEQYNGLLNGNPNAKEPDELHLKSLLSDDDSTIRPSGEVPDSIKSGWLATFTKSTASSTLNNRDFGQRAELGAQSVPLQLMSASQFSDQRGVKLSDREQINSALEFPVSFDPFDSIDPFKISDFAQFDSEFSKTDDPFVVKTNSLIIDPFKDSDPFDADPFSLSELNENAKSQCANQTFDPFKRKFLDSSAREPTSPVIDFDSVFGTVTTTSDFNDPFSSDPFTISSNQLASDLVKDTATTKKSPPPRPKALPNPSKNVRNLKNGSTNISTTTNSDGNYTDGGNAIENNTTSRNRKRFVAPLQKSSFNLKTKTIGRGKKDSRSGSTPTLYADHRNNGSKDVDVVALSSFKATDDIQLSVAIMESQRLARLEEEARKQEEADLELAIRLSKLDASKS